MEGERFDDPGIYKIGRMTKLNFFNRLASLLKDENTARAFADTGDISYPVQIEDAELRDFRMYLGWNMRAWFLSAFKLRGKYALYLNFESPIGALMLAEAVGEQGGLVAADPDPDIAACLKNMIKTYGKAYNGSRELSDNTSSMCLTIPPKSREDLSKWKKFMVRHKFDSIVIYRWFTDMLESSRRTKEPSAKLMLAGLSHILKPDGEILIWALSGELEKAAAQYLYESGRVEEDQKENVAGRLEEEEEALRECLEQMAGSAGFQITKMMKKTGRVEAGFFTEPYISWAIQMKKIEGD